MLRLSTRLRTTPRGVRAFGAGGSRDHLWPDGQRKINADWGAIEHYHDPLPYLPKEQDPNMPKLNIVEERGKKWIKPGYIPEGMDKTYGIPQVNIPFYARSRMRIWGNHDMINITEYAFFWIPTVIIGGLVIPLFTCLYCLEEAVYTTMTVKVTGRQWYWIYEVESPPAGDDDDEDEDDD